MSGICKKCLRSGYPDAMIGKPCKSCKDGVIERDPPFRELVDTLPEPMTCGRRKYDQYAPGFPVHGARSLDNGQDRWEKFKSNGDRVCSFCGSLHPEDFFALVKQAAVASVDAEYSQTVSIEPSDKGYKVYVHRPGVRNAMEGGIKFYKQHLPRKADGSLDITEEQEKEFALAVRQSRSRYDRYLHSRYPMES